MDKDKRVHVTIILFFILAVGFLLRINHWFDFLGADEIGKTGLMTWTWDLHKDPFPVHYYPPFFLYINFIFSFILKKLAVFLGIIDFENIFMKTDFGFIFTLKTGRLLSAVFGTFNIYMVYLLGREFFNRYAGLCGALILAVFWPHVIDSHNFKSDVLLTLLVTLLVYFTLKFVREKKGLHLFLASLFLGLSVATKYNGVFFGIVLIIPLILLRKEFPPVRGLFFILAGGMTGFFSGAPNWLVHPVSNVKTTLQYLKGLSQEVVWVDPFPSSFVLYGKNLIEHFGIVLILILIAGMGWSVVRKSRNGMIISAGILFYFIMAGRENYLNYRAVLPLVPLIAVLTGKFLFADIRDMFKKPAVRMGALILLLIPVAVYTAVNFTRSYKSFDLLRGIASHPVRERAGIGEPDHSSYYMKNHFTEGNRIFREMWTPPADCCRGSVFGRDVTRIPLKMFSGERSFDFLITSFSTDYILKRAENRQVIDDAKQRLKEYAPFHTVNRPAIFTWSDDITFWYRKPDHVRSNLKMDNGIRLPRTYVKFPDNPSVHLPLQRYEKDPCYGVVDNGVSGKYIYSFKKLKRIVFHYPGTAGLKMVFNVNGRSADSSPGPDSFTGHAVLDDPVPGEFGGIAIRRLYEADMDKDRFKSRFFIYKVEVRANTRGAVPFTFFTYFEGEDHTTGSMPPVTAPRRSGDIGIPSLFSGGEADPRVKDFYKKNGVDLVLLSKMNRLEIYDNKENSVNGPATGYLPLSRGHYLIRVDTVRIVKNMPAGENAKISMALISGKNKCRVTGDVKEGISFIPVVFNHDSGFFRLALHGLRDSNLMVGQITLEPDLILY